MVKNRIREIDSQANASSSSSSIQIENQIDNSLEVSSSPTSSSSNETITPFNKDSSLFKDKLSDAMY
jgi:hypothetical protein